ncbi:hypothetical protein NPIL_53461 [Nephila pilipes]|uniref:Uncharacterized protein n=1 Tax=Nephila pilipes TaxID=299642 RepID=A0A8X6PD50_NEPPI|nr:hypothetical protein NPIL_53461 [Nephila pilipes]
METSPNSTRRRMASDVYADRTPTGTLSSRARLRYLLVGEKPVIRLINSRPSFDPSRDQLADQSSPGVGLPRLRLWERDYLRIR